MPEVDFQTLPDIKIEIRLLGPGRIPAHVLLRTVELVDRAIMRAEENELEAIASELPTISTVSFDAARYRFSRLSPGRALNLEAAATGSLLLFGVGAALAYWLVENTVGETVKEAWLESETHKKLKAFLLRRRFLKAKMIADGINKFNWHRDEMNTKVDVEETPSGPRLVVAVTVPEALSELPPPNRSR